MSKKTNTTPTDEMPLFDIGGVIIPAVDFDSLRSGEWATIKRRTGCRPPAFIDAMHELDPDCWMAYIHVCAVRAHTKLSDGALDGLDLVDLTKTLFRFDEEDEAVEQEAAAEAE